MMDVLVGLFDIYRTNDDPKLTKIVNQYKYSYNHSYYHPTNPNLTYNHANNTFVHNFNYNTKPADAAESNNGAGMCFGCFV